MRWLLATLLLAGCARSPLDDSLYAQQEAVRPPAAMAGPSAPAALPEDAGVEDYVALALQRNPELRRARFAVERMTARVPQATSLDDPMLEVAPIGEMAETAAGMAGVMTSISQTFPTPGKRDARGQIASREAAMAQRELEAARLRIAAEVRRAYWSYAFAARALGIYDQQHALLAQMRDAAAAQYEAGGGMRGSQQMLIDTGIMVREIDADRLMLAQQRDGSIAMLNRLLDRPPATPLPPPRPARDAAFVEDGVFVADDHPRLEGARERAAMYHAQWRLAKLDRWPDLTVGVNYVQVEDEGMAMDPTGKDQWWVSFGVNLPIWTGRRDAAEREALAGLGEATAELVAERNSLAFAAHDALLRVRTQRQLVALFRDDILPQARHGAEAARAAYESGGGDFTAVVDATRRTLGVELAHLRAVTQLEQDLADLREAIGRDFPEENHDEALTE